MPLLNKRCLLLLCRLRLIEDLQESMRVKEEFLSMVSHELRTPLNGIIGQSSVRVLITVFC